MATITQVAVNGSSVANTDVQEISVAYNELNDEVTVNPIGVGKNSTVRFKDPAGGKLRIVFLSPTGKPTDTVLDSELCTLTIGGTYHFKCFFTPPGATSEISPENGGVIDVTPTRP